MRIANLKPSPLLRPYIDRYWVWDGESVLPTMLPGTGAELMLHYGPCIQLAAADAVAAALLPAAYLICPRRRYFTLAATAPVRFIAVRFRAGALRHFCAIPVAQLTDAFLDMGHVWGAAGRQLHAQLLGADTLAARIERVEAFLLAQLALHRQTQAPWLDMAFRRLYYSSPGVPLDKIIAAANVSTRTFQQVFKQNAGVSPKFFQRVTRFEDMVKTLLLQRQTRYLDVALAHGYCDQSHAIKDFAAFTGQAPLAYLQERNFLAHFYNPHRQA